MKIKTCDNKGIRITRDGIVFSIQFGAGNYCENNNKSIADQFMNKPNTESNDCEMAVFLEDSEKWLTKEVFPENDDDVIGYLPIEKALRIALDWKRELK